MFHKHSQTKLCLSLFIRQHVFTFFKTLKTFKSNVVINEIVNYSKIFGNLVVVSQSELALKRLLPEPCVCARLWVRECMTTNLYREVRMRVSHLFFERKTLAEHKLNARHIPNCCRLHIILKTRQRGLSV